MEGRLGVLALAADLCAWLHPVAPPQLPLPLAALPLPSPAGQGITTGVLQSEALGQLLEQRRSAAAGDLAAALRGLPNVSVGEGPAD
jgi:hypothetical protein